MIWPQWKSAGYLLILTSLGSALAEAKVTRPSGFIYGVLWYTRAPDEATVALGAKRFQVGITGKEERIDQAAVKSRNPGFEWFVYNSATDNYVPPHRGADEHASLVSSAREKGWDPEEGYLHYAEDTRLVLQGDTLLIRGWPHGSARSPAEARIPVYEGDGSRRLVNFSTPRSAQLQKEVILRSALDTPFEGTSIYPDGIFLDNAGARLFHFGDILSGARWPRREGPAFKAWPSRHGNGKKTWVLFLPASRTRWKPPPVGPGTIAKSVS